MDEPIIQYHNFEQAKKELKAFSEQTVTDLDLRRVDDSKGLGEFVGDVFFGRGIGLDHKVTGEELNELTTQIQEHLYSMNNTQNKLIQEFGEVYNALEALDKGYIQAILVSIKSTEETSRGIQTAQENIKKIIERQRKTLEELNKFKQKLSGYAHLNDIDKVWSDYQSVSSKIDTLSESVDDAVQSSRESLEKADAMSSALTVAENKIAELSVQIDGAIEKLESVIAVTTKIEQITHLTDVDEMWTALSVAQDSIRGLSNGVEEIQNAMSQNQEDINSLLTFMNKLSSLKHLTEVDELWEKCALSHLKDVDRMWNAVEQHSAQLTESEKRNEEFAAAVQTRCDETDRKLSDTLQAANSAVESLTRKIRYVYWIAGGSAGLAIVELILLLAKVM